MNGVKFLLPFLALTAELFTATNALVTSSPQRVSIVTGANGYVGREIVHTLLKEPDQQQVLCLVRPARISEEQDYWKASLRVKVLPYDMLDDGCTLEHALDCAFEGNPNECCVYHVASVFGPTEDHKATALHNVKGTEQVVNSIAKYKNCKLVLTSSMAAVRGTGQEPLNGKTYTYRDWNTLSKLGDNWGASYQWSKAESERRAWDLAKALDVPMVALCPSFVFGPPSDGMDSNSYSITLVSQWVRGESPVQSRLCVDIRDVAKAHVASGTLPSAIGNRYIVSSESRIPSQDAAEALRKVAQETGLGDPDKITFDADFSGGAIPIGEPEVEAVDRLRNDLGGLELRPVEETMADMGRALLQMTIASTS
jgi:nucleoside-diphosphate-sugar epimerase